MTKCTTRPMDFTNCKQRLVQTDFTGGDITSDGGAVLLREMDRRLQLTDDIARSLSDHRRKKQIRHDPASLLRQRVYAICLGYEDLNDHETLRTDPLIQTALGKTQALASPSTLCRFENRMGCDEAIAIHKVLVDRFIASYSDGPEELILDFDATDDAIHGRQEGRFFHGFSDHYCFLPLCLTGNYSAAVPGRNGTGTQSSCNNPPETTQDRSGDYT
ncbi:transposase [Desulfopila sp. IMCC35006]|uniref:transposase n=1 Tax=Desulfopila sp. IMCC35006 TaxID=2569542 RepID=UPI002684093E